MIGDFGVSKKSNLAETFVGTPYYLSPEIINGWTYTKKADVWSLGVLFYELVSLRYPFTVSNPSMPALTFKILKGIYPELPSSIDSSVKSMIRSMLIITPEQRPSLNSLMGNLLLKRLLYCSNDPLGEWYSSSGCAGQRAEQRRPNKQHQVRQHTVRRRDS